MTTEPETKTLVLRKPVKLAELSYETLELREPTLGELEAAGKAGGGISTDIELLARVTGHPPAAIKKRGARDYKEAIGFVTSFLTDAPQTGENSSPT